MQDGAAGDLGQTRHNVVEAVQACAEAAWGDRRHLLRHAGVTRSEEVSRSPEGRRGERRHQDRLRRPRRAARAGSNRVLSDGSLPTVPGDARPSEGSATGFAPAAPGAGLAPAGPEAPPGRLDPPHFPTAWWS